MFDIPPKSARVIVLALKSISPVYVFPLNCFTVLMAYTVRPIFVVFSMCAPFFI